MGFKKYLFPLKILVTPSLLLVCTQLYAACEVTFEGLQDNQSNPPKVVVDFHLSYFNTSIKKTLGPGGVMTLFDEVCHGSKMNDTFTWGGNVKANGKIVAQYHNITASINGARILVHYHNDGTVTLEPG